MKACILCWSDILQYTRSLTLCCCTGMHRVCAPSGSLLAKLVVAAGSMQSVNASVTTESTGNTHQGLERTSSCSDPMKSAHCRVKLYRPGDPAVTCCGLAGFLSAVTANVQVLWVQGRTGICWLPHLIGSHRRTVLKLLQAGE